MESNVFKFTEIRWIYVTCHTEALVRSTIYKTFTNYYVIQCTLGTLEASVSCTVW